MRLVPRLLVASLCLALATPGLAQSAPAAQAEVGIAPQMLFERSSLQADVDILERTYTAITGQNPPNLDLGQEERAMAAKVFAPVTDIGAVEDALRNVKAVEGLHPTMRFEALNFADGKRNAYEVYEAVAAEALSAGEWYFGAVKPADVLELLERAARAGVLTVKGAK